MNVLVVGQGGREHALCWKLRQSPLHKRLFCAPGNPGTAAIAENVDVAAEDIQGLLRFAVDNKIQISTPQFFLGESYNRVCDEDTDLGLRYTLGIVAPRLEEP